MAKEIFGVKAPAKTCTDGKCPFHGSLNVKREFIKGVVVKKDINRSATIQWKRSVPVPKYERTAVRLSRLRVHNPACIDAKVGDNVLVARTRPISKTKNHIIIDVLGSELLLNEAVKEDEPVKKEAKSKKAQKADEAGENTQ